VHLVSQTTVTNSVLIPEQKIVTASMIRVLCDHAERTMKRNALKGRSDCETTCTMRVNVWDVLAGLLMRATLSLDWKVWISRATASLCMPILNKRHHEQASFGTPY